MMLGHLTIAGLAELVVTGGVVAYLQKSDPALLKQSAPGARSAEDDAPARGWAATRSLWIGLAVLMIASPLGLLAAGTAWGEWAPGELPPNGPGQGPGAGATPAGLERLSSIWTAPIPDYAPHWMKSESFGYILSAMMGIGLILLTFLVISGISRLLSRRNSDAAPASPGGSA
jgi:cobalt/nickel transport system permease protein